MEYVDPDEIAAIYQDALDELDRFADAIDTLFHLRPAGEVLH